MVNRVKFSTSAVCICLGVFLFAGVAAKKLVWAHERRQARRNPSNDVILACLQKQGMPVYAVGPDGPPPLGQPVTAEMFTVICVEEK